MIRVSLGWPAIDDCWAFSRRVNDGGDDSRRQDRAQHGLKGGCQIRRANIRGQLPIEMTVDDFGSSGENEKQALLEVRKLLEKALDTVRNKLG